MRDGHAAVVAVHDALRIRGIDPQAVMISVRRGKQLEALAAVVGAERAGVEHVHRVGRLRIGEDVSEVPGALAITLIVVDARPGIAGVVGAIEAALLRFDQRVDAIGVRARNRNADASQLAFGQAMAFQMFPGESAVGRFDRVRCPGRRW